MRPYIQIIKMIPAALFISACSDTDRLPGSEEEFGPQVEKLAMTLTGIEADASESRATVKPYIVNTILKDSDPYDPTTTAMESRINWEADVKIYKGNNIYSTHGEATYTYQSTKWDFKSPSTALRFPNYTKQKITATFHPAAWSTGSEFVKDQSQTDGVNLLAQDILINEGTTYNPAKQISIEMKHANSMLDFIINDIADADISSVSVKINSVEYIPYKANTDPVEYLLIVPTTTNAQEQRHNPQIEIRTTSNSTYQQEIKLIGAKNGNNTITNYTVNTCYCFTLKGLELILSPITVTDWTTGAAVAGDYIAVTAYPTFRGTVNTTYYVYYDNCLKDAAGNPQMQKITFNSRGECTIKPDGRIITHIGTENDVSKATELKDNAVLLKDMIVDLNNAISKIGTN